MISIRLGHATATLALCVGLAACSPSDPSPSIRPSASPSTSLGFTPPALVDMPSRLINPTGDEFRAAAENPRTGEIWLTEPDGLEPAVPIIAEGRGNLLPVHVGSRGDAEIFLVVSPTFFFGTYRTYFVVELRDDTAFVIACPDPAQHPCPWTGGLFDPETQGLAPSVLLDGDVFYDSLAMPPTVMVDPSLPVATPGINSRDSASFKWGNWGQAWSPVATIPYDLVPDYHQDMSSFEKETLTTVGGWALVLYRYSRQADRPGETLPSAFLVWTSPLGTTYPAMLGTRGAPLSLDSVQWLEGLEPFAPDGFGQSENAPFPVGFFPDDPESRGAVYVAAWGNECDPVGVSVDDAHDPAQWRQGGTLATGQPVYIPIDGGNDWSRLLWSSYSDRHQAYVLDDSYGPHASPPYLETEQAFLDARALIEIQAPNGEWWMLVVNEASDNYSVYGCN